MSSQKAYDEVPYVTNPFAETQPSRLRTVAMLFGHNPPDPHRGRVLELGCAGGGNLVPMAYLYPEAQFVGIDISPVQIEQARKFADGVGLKNIDLRVLSITDIDASFGSFDYIIAHGVLSWVPPPVQEGVFRVCRDHLSPEGVAYISFNTFPGWHTRMRVREMMLYHVAQFSDPIQKAREARALVKLVAESPPVARNAKIGEVLKSEWDLLKDKPDEYVLHEYLEEHNHPMYFQEFIERAAAHDLKYLGDARMNGTPADEGWPDAEKIAAMAAGDPLRLEQYADFLRDTAFRRAILCRPHAKVNRAGAARRARGMHVLSQLKPSDQQGELVKFVHSRGGGLGSTHPVMKAALIHLHSISPRAMPFEDLFTLVARQTRVPEEQLELQATNLASELLRYWMVNFVEFYAAPPHLVPSPGPMPRASAVARYQASLIARVTNLRHEPVTLDDPGRKLIVLCDGTRTHEQIISDLKPQFPNAPPDAFNGWLGPALSNLGQAALLEA